MLFDVHGSSVDDNGGPVDAHLGHNDPRHVLVAVGDADIGVIVQTLCHRLHRVCYDLPRQERVAHALCAHRDGVTYADCIESTKEIVGSRGGYKERGDASSSSVGTRLPDHPKGSIFGTVLQIPFSADGP